MRSSRGLLHNLGILTVGQVVSQLLNVWALVYLAGRLGAHWFGAVQVGVAFMGYALVAAEGGLFALGVREVARLDAPGSVLRYARGQQGLLILQGAVVIALGLVLIPLLPIRRPDAWIPILYLLAIVPQLGQLDWLGLGLEKMSHVGALRIARSLVYALAVLGGLHLLGGLQGAEAARLVPVMWFAAMAASNLVVLVPARLWLGGWVRPGRPAPGEARRRWSAAAPIGASALVMRVLLNIDLLLLGVMARPEDAGHYAAAARLIAFLIVAVEVLWAALLPRQSRLASQDPAGFRQAFNLYLGAVMGALLPLALGGLLLAPGIIARLYPAEYAGAAPVFAVLSVSYSLLAVAMYLGNTLVACDRQKQYVGPVAVAATVTLAAVTLLIRSHGAVGASWGMLAGHGLLAAWLAIVNRHLFRRRLGLLLLQLAPALGALVAAVMATAGWPVVLRIAAGGAAYALAAALPLRSFLRTRGA
ncbi:MAG TPA: oligosaccharide flippase family protein [Candidatus Krumholzibacteria bacterium]|nr:oligosaccharide flippase family protein [Candidatus Krumholzibacteria bacterium]